MEPILDANALEALADPAVVRALEPSLERLTRDVDILLFVAPGCPACPNQVRSVAALTLASPRVVAEIVDATREPALAAEYEVRSVPTTVIDDELILVGVKHPAEMANLLMARQGPSGELAHLMARVEAGRTTEAADQLLNGPDPHAAAKAFAFLWSRSALQGRMGLALVAEEVLERDPEGLNALVPFLVAGLEGGPLAGDAPLRGDTADLLGQIGHPDARPVLEALTRDENEDVAEVARDALAALR